MLAPRLEELLETISKRSSEQDAEFQNKMIRLLEIILISMDLE